jgi:NAD(P)H-dependent FMN reductase
MTNDIRIAIIVASTREGRFGSTVARWFAGHASGRDDLDLDLDVLDLAELDLPDVIGGDPTPDLEGFLARLEAADGFVVITPEYNHGYPASLKQAVDLAGRQWHAKPVAFVSYGGMSGGLRAVEQLRLVFAELHAMTIRDVVSLHNPWRFFDSDARLVADVGADAAADVLLERLLWWARALRSAREEVAYAA